QLRKMEILEAAHAPDLAGERPDEVLRQAERLADIAQRAPRAVADDRRAERGAVAAIGLEDPLHHGLAPLVLEIHVDIGRLAPFLGDEPLEGEVVAPGIERGDTEDIADHRISRRRAPLTEDALRPRETRDGIHGD